MQEAHFAKSIAWLLRTQAVLAGLAGVVFAILGGAGPALAALGGGLLGVILTAVTALRIGMSMEAAAGETGPEIQALLRAFYRAMALKLTLAVVLFVIVAKWFPGYFGPVVSGYAATLVAYWLALWRLRSQDADTGTK